MDPDPVPESLSTKASAEAAVALEFRVPHDHPALAGHFPGNPVVPGVVILDQVFARLGIAPDRERRLAWVKFLHPLLPGERAEIATSRDGSRLRFAVSVAGRLIASGQLLEVGDPGAETLP